MGIGAAFRVFIAVLIAMGGISGIPAGRAISWSGCLMNPNPDPVERLRGAVQYADLVVIASVVEEVPVDYVLDGNQLTAVPRRHPQPSERTGAYQARIRIEVVLKGNLSASELTLDGLSDVWLCAGGPRIPEDARVLLALSGSGDSYQTGPLGSPVLLLNRGAYLADYAVPTRGIKPMPQRIGSTIGVIDLVSAESAYPPDGNAFAFARPAPNREFIWWGTAVGVFVLGLLSMTYARRG
jgi:hypothetical protein